MHRRSRSRRRIRTLRRPPWSKAPWFRKRRRSRAGALALCVAGFPGFRVLHRGPSPDRFPHRRPRTPAPLKRPSARTRPGLPFPHRPPEQLPHRDPRLPLRRRPRALHCGGDSRVSRAVRAGRPRGPRRCRRPSCPRHPPRPTPWTSPPLRRRPLRRRPSSPPQWFGSRRRKRMRRLLLLSGQARSRPGRRHRGLPRPLLSGMSARQHPARPHLAQRRRRRNRAGSPESLRALSSAAR